MEEKQYYQSLPRKRVGAAALLLNSRGELLIVKPHYKEQWLLPGGVVEADESPHAGCLREVREEIGVTLPAVRLLAVDYYPDQGGKGEALQFVFFGGVLSEENLHDVKLEEGEIDAWKCAPPNEALRLVSEHLGRRIVSCLQALKRDAAVYLEEGTAIHP